MSRIKILPGAEVNGLVLLERLAPRPFPGGKQVEYKARWRCLACGREDYLATLSNAKKSRTGSCGCLFNQSAHLEKVHTRDKVLKGDNLPKFLWSAARDRHINMGFAYSTLISREALFKLWLAQEGKCAVSGLPIEMYVQSSMRNHPAFANSLDCKNKASLDRIDSRFGYEEGNVQWVHTDVNQLKWDFSAEYFLVLCRAVSKHQGSLSWEDDRKIADFDPERMFKRSRGSRVGSAARKEKE